MMPISEKITEDLKEAMKARDQLRVSCLRMLKTSIKNKEIALGRQLTDEETRSLIFSSIRMGQEAAEEFRKGNREDLAAKEEHEIKILYGYLPEQFTPDKIEEVIKEVIAEVSASEMKDLGTVMKASMSRMAGKVQGKEVNEIARKLLSQPAK
ncbi:GatB/YqeY domain-containing protein [Thermodesulfobacteriota bacterium]